MRELVIRLICLTTIKLAVFKKRQENGGDELDM